MQLPQLSQVDMPDPKNQAPKAAHDNNETPEDVATLYSWANLHGAKYRDFSAARAQAREAAKLRVEEAAAAERRRQQEETERRMQEEAQRAAREAAEAAEEARQAEAERLAELARQAEVERQAVLAAQEAQRQAVQQRGWQSQPAPAVAAAAHAMRPVAAVPSVPQAYVPAATSSFVSPVPAEAERLAPQPVRAAEAARESLYREPRPISPPPAPAQNAAYSDLPSFFSPPAVEEAPPSWPGTLSESVSEADLRPSWLSEEVPASIPEAAVQGHAVVHAEPVAAPLAGSQTYSSSFPAMAPFGAQPNASSAFALQEAGFAPAASYPVIEPPVTPPPAILTPFSSAGQLAVVSSPLSQAAQPVVPPSLLPYSGQESGGLRGGGNRWFALKSVFDPHSAPVDQLPLQQPAQVPVLAVFSLAGGVGKTSIIASLGRALSTRGEQVLLVDTTAYGLLPFFFGARDQRPGHLRTFNPPGVSLEAPIQVITLDPEAPASDALSDSSLTGSSAPAYDRPQEWLSVEIARLARAHHRVLIDLPSASGATTRRILRLNPLVLVPVVPDMNSVVSVGAIESFFRHNGATGGVKAVQPYYLLNQFDSSLPLHLDVRELLREQIGDRLLPFTLRRSPAVSEALAEGMTVMDYASSAPLAEDFSSLAGWVRSLAGPATQANRGVRWSER